jgi:hypothetical protein
MQRDDLIYLFTDIEDRQKYIGELRAEIKETFQTFADANDTPVKALKDGFKFYVAMNKDKADASLCELTRDKIIDALMAG